MTAPTPAAGGLAGLFVVMTSATLIQYVLGALGPYLTEALELPAARYGWLLTGVYVVAGTASLLGGRLLSALRVPRAFTVTTCMVAVLFLASSATRGPVSFGLVVAAFGVPLAIANPAVNAYIAARVSNQRQAGHLGVLQAGVAFGALLASLILPTAVDAYGWRAVLAGTGLLAGCAVPFVGRVLGGQPAVEIVPSQQHAGGPARGIRGLSLYALLVGMVVAATVSYLALFAHGQLGMSRTVAAGVMAVMAAVSGFARIGWGAVLGRWTKGVGLLAGLGVVMAAGAGSMAVAERLNVPSLVWVGAVAFGASSAAWVPVGTLLLVRAVPRELVARASGQMLSAYYLGLIVGPAGFGLVLTVTDAVYAPAWLCLSALGLAASLACIPLGPRRSVAANAR